MLDGMPIKFHHTQLTGLISEAHRMEKEPQKDKTEIAIETNSGKLSVVI